MATTSDLRPGVFIRFNGELCHVLESEHRTPGNLRAFYQVKMRVVRSGRLLENRFRSGEDIDLVRVERRPYQFLYRDDTVYVFMDKDTYEQIPVDASVIGEAAGFLKEGQDIDLMFEGETVLSIEMPPHVILRVDYTEPGFKGDTTSNVLKPARLETGTSIEVPLFVNSGDLIKVDTRTGEYVERVKE